MLDLLHSQLYAYPEDLDLLKTEPEYVRHRFFTIIKTILETPFRWTRQQAAGSLHISKRHIQRLIGAFLLLGIPGLRYKFKRLKISLPPSCRLRLHGAPSNHFRGPSFVRPAPTPSSFAINPPIRRPGASWPELGAGTAQRPPSHPNRCRVTPSGSSHRLGVGGVL